MKPADHTGPCCKCFDCEQAGVSDRPQVRDPVTGRWLHGYRLKEFHERADAALERIRQKLNTTTTKKIT